MLVSKVGYAHWEMGINCQDAALEDVISNEPFGEMPFKVVADGCSEACHSEVGAKMFCHMMKTHYPMDIFKVLNELFIRHNDKKNYLLFTSLICYDIDDHWRVRISGDGTIIKQTHDDKLEYQRFDYNSKPPYFEYNYMDKEYLSDYKDGVQFQSFCFLKTDYKAIGLASDGIDYILSSPFRAEFEALLLARKEAPLKRLINREHKFFKDDITVVI